MKRVYIFIFTIIFTTFVYASKSIDIDLSSQKLYAKENGRIVFSGSISSGKRGHSTPRGVFRILEKEKFHISNKYPEPKGGAKMPYMHRLTKSGIAIHQGYLPGYPASHGCIRVSKSTALKLWRWSRNGIKVKVYGNAANFRYVKKKKSKKRQYAKRKEHNKRKYAKKRARKIKHYTKRDRSSSYEIIEIYDSW